MDSFDSVRWRFLQNALVFTGEESTWLSGSVIVQRTMGSRSSTMDQVGRPSSWHTIMMCGRCSIISPRTAASVTNIIMKLQQTHLISQAEGRDW